MKISVVVAVYNPGRYLEAPVESFLRQTLPRAEFEVIFVDDGSTDGSGKGLDRLARQHRTFRVLHIPNSGWPGRPRNLGIDAAIGRYVLFVDHDDWLEDDALEYLWNVAEANGADVVAARELGHGFGVPRRMFRRTVPDAKLGHDDILALLTPHKLFRRQMLVDHGIRFPEGPRRLEDHHFVIQAYFAARRITVTGDHPVYHWAKREEGTNATRMPFARELYYDNLREILDIVDRNTEPGELRDRLYAHWLRYKMVHKLLRPQFRSPGPDSRRLYAEIRRLMDERFAPAVDRHLPVGYRLVARAVRADRLDVVVAAAHLANGLSLDLDVRAVTVDGTISIDLDHGLRGPDGKLLRLRRVGDRLAWHPPADMTAGLDPAPEDLLADPADAELALVARQRGTDLEHDSTAPLPMRTATDDDAVEVAGLATMRLEPSTFAAGQGLPDGTWDLLVGAEFAGFRAIRRIPVPSAPTSRGRARVRAYATTRGNLALAIGDARAGQQPMHPAARVLLAGLPGGAREAARRILPRSARRLARRLVDGIRS